jgi:hydroxymethylglutaryl-CoA reductase (NADPH)
MAKYAEYIAQLQNGTKKLYSLEGEVPVREALDIRRAYIETETDCSLAHVGAYTIPVDEVALKNCENMIGTIQVPLGVAGPLLVNGEYAQGSFWLPLATTEGALVASINRGCGAITKAGGAEVRIFADGMTRAPVFATQSISHAKEVYDWILAHEQEIGDIAEATTKFGKLLEIYVVTVGTSVHTRFSFFTGDAMGMNMITIASEKACEFISNQTGARLVSLSGNFCTDKKPASVTSIMGRGKTVSAGVHLKHAAIESIFKTDAVSLLDVHVRKNLAGSARAHSLGFNAHAANVISAMFIALGQDPAHVVEGALCITTIEPTDDGVYAAVTLPALPVGTIGGGTRVATQQDCLSLLGVKGAGDVPGVHAKKLAEIIAAGVLAGELSLLGAQAAQHLARAHQMLGR